MTVPAYVDDSVTVHLGDCLDVLATLPDSSVDSVVCDPPYGLEFMGKDWDAPWKENGRWSEGAYGQQGRIAGRGGMDTWGARPQYAAGLPFQQWCESWAVECFRVLKPGGHLLAFGGTRTWHRLTCAIEDAGFEIRDSIAWLYGQGFAKSLNLDNIKNSPFCQCATGESDHADHQVRGVRANVPRPPADTSAGDLTDLFSPVQRESARAGVGSARTQGLGGTQDVHADVWPGESGMEGRRDVQAAEGQLCRPEVRSLPEGTADDGKVGRLRDGAPAGDGTPNWSPAAPVGVCEPHQPRPAGQPSGEPRAVSVERGPQAWGGWPVCARCAKPAIPSGLGTALKPAHEPIVVARKPLVGTVAANVVAYGTGALNIDACRVGNDGGCAGAGQGPQGDVYGDGLNGSFAPRVPGLGRWPANVVLDEHYEPVIRLRDNLPTETERIIREFFGADTSHMPAMRNVSDRVAESGYETEVLLTPVPRGMDDGEPDWRERAPLRQGAHAGVSTQDERDEEGAAANGPEESSVARRNLSGARVRDGQSVGADGRGADADCPDDPTGRHSCSHPSTPADSCEGAGPAAVADRACAPSERREGRQPSRESGGSLGDRAPAHPRGSRPGVASAATRERRAAGACLDVLRRDCPPGWRHHFDVVGSRREGQAAALDQQTGNRPGAVSNGSKTTEGLAGTDTFRIHQREQTPGYDDDGGPSRFFPTFRYEAKAPSSERPGADGIAHPTVKPLDLMRWLVRLVTPRGGLVLDPFAGSGTTGEACVIEGFKCVLIERDPSYLPLIVRRLTKPIQVGLDFGEETTA